MWRRRMKGAFLQDEEGSRCVKLPCRAVEHGRALRWRGARYFFLFLAEIIEPAALAAMVFSISESVCPRP